MAHHPPHQSGISLKNVTVTLGGNQILCNISVELPHKRIGVIGRNGSGKSTLARLLNGLIPADVGDVFVNGIDISNDRRAALNTVGLIFQNPDHQIIFPTVQEELAFGLQQQGRTAHDARTRAQEILNLHGHKDWAERATHTLSQGQRHLLCLLSILAMEPSVIVLDEPFAGLDLPNTIYLHNWLKKLAQSLVLISHVPDLLQDFDHILWMEAGQIAQQGPPQDVLPDYVSQMTKEGENLC